MCNGGAWEAFPQSSCSSGIWKDHTSLPLWKLGLAMGLALKCQWTEQQLLQGGSFKSQYIIPPAVVIVEAHVHVLSLPQPESLRNNNKEPLPDPLLVLNMRYKWGINFDCVEPLDFGTVCYCSKPWPILNDTPVQSEISQDLYSSTIYWKLQLTR